MSNWRNFLPTIAILIVTAALPAVTGNLYYLHVATMIVVYWILIASLNLLVGFTGQLSVGHVGLLAIGAYAYAILTNNFNWNSLLAIGAAGAITAGVGFLLGLPSLRFPGFYFAMVTTAFGMIVTELALAWSGLTNGSIGMAVAQLPPPFGSPVAFYYLAAGTAALVTLLSWNLVRSMWGRAMLAVRDNKVAAASVGINVHWTMLSVFVFSGFTAGIAGAFYGISQNYITPDAFVLNLGLFFFVSIIIGGRGSIIGPFLGAAILAAIPELVGSLQKYGTFFYGAILLLVVLLVPGGIGELVQSVHKKLKAAPEAMAFDIKPDLERLRRALNNSRPQSESLQGRLLVKRFGGNVAVNSLSISVRRAEVHGLIGPNGSGKTTVLNLLSGFYPLTSGEIRLGVNDLTKSAVRRRPRLGISRTFQKPRLVGSLSVLDNAMLGGWPTVRGTFIEAAWWLRRARRDDTDLRSRAEEVLRGVGLVDVINCRADLLSHTCQRFVEIARALVLRPDFVLMDEPAGGLTEIEIRHLASIICTLKECGIGVLIIEHHTDFIFGTCDRVTALDVGAVISQGLPKEVQADPEVARVYLGV